MLSNEEWRVVPSQPEMMASSFGRVWVKPHIGKMPNGALRAYETLPTYGVEEKSATGRKDSPRRKIIRVRRLNKTFKVHQLVCEAFHGAKPFPDAIVLHLDENPSNNVPGNLRWGTRKENQNFPEVLAAFRARTGEASPRAIHKKRNAA